ncbi:MAG: helix-turn-helix domain-containing protein [Sphingobium sp.]|uniref:helix-turn-helix domain-containing protein n=1 Tax=Sphingobium sp. TaxID=1912891 RepID=UPI002E212355
MIPLAEIDALKAAMGVRTDVALADVLKVNKSCIQNWRRRGRVSDYARHRAQMLIEHGQIGKADNMEKLAAELNALSQRLGNFLYGPGRLAADLEALAARARAIGGAQ